jgi:hypothetical protein
MFDALEEDRRTAWVPDALGDGDLREVLSASDGVKMWELRHRWLSVPRPDGRFMRVVVLPWQAVAELHIATEALRDTSDSRLKPSVFGYRRGAVPGSSYAIEFQRFCDITNSEAEHAGVVVYADVRGFFRHASWHSVLGAARATGGESSITELSRWISRATNEGLSHLPPGYADARLLGNLVLAAIDEKLSGVSFARWVDDYRLFVDDADAADQALALLRRELAAWGFALAPEKLRVYTDRSVLMPDELASVYHPEHETPLQVRSALRTIWAEAAADPIRKRRRLRFTLPRMAEQGDAVAIPFCLDGLVNLPWEAPRLIAYLSAFSTDPHVQQGVADALCGAIAQDDLWRVARILPLACRLPSASVRREAIPAILKSLTRLRRSPVWGLALRLLAVHRVEAAGEEAAIANAPDPRAALAARADLGLSLDVHAVSQARITSNWLGTHGVAPLPRIDGVL